MTNEQERLNILEQIDAGRITAAEGVRRLEALTAGRPLGTEAPAPEPEPAARAAPADAPPDLAHWRRWWVFPFGVGLALTLLSSLGLYWALRAADFRLTGWFFLALLPFAGSVALMALAAASRGARWLHVRVNTGGARQIRLSFPLPIRLTAWALRTFGPRLPQLKHTSVDELILALGESTSPQNPLYVEVDEGQAGEKVQVYIG
ncbi:MAG: hypothetical protein JNK29_16245 [Anaerolineales bacterium]|nr:hypothetical protein [Anaerolineales bacterium]